MNKHIVCAAVLAVLAGTAAAQQTNVTIYGKLDLGVGQKIGTKDKDVIDAAGSRLGFRGTEDLGGGLSAQFQIEHRFNPDDGTANATFWQGQSWVGLNSPYGSLKLGRQYMAAWIVQNEIDPWGGDTVAGLRDIGTRPKDDLITKASRVGDTRVADLVRYDVKFGSVAVAATVGATPAGKTDRPVAFGATWKSGPAFVGLGYENPANDKDRVLTVGGTYDLGMVKLAAAYAAGKTTADADTTSWLLGGTVPFGALDVKIGYAKTTVEAAGSDKSIGKFGLGAHYNLSKRTKVYADVAKVTGNLSDSLVKKTGFDLGVQHNF